MVRFARRATAGRRLRPSGRVRRFTGSARKKRGARLDFIGALWSILVVRKLNALTDGFMRSTFHTATPGRMRASGMRKVNAALLLEIIRSEGRISRAELGPPERVDEAHGLEPGG
jgi:hypothetical protein